MSLFEQGYVQCVRNYGRPIQMIEYLRRNRFLIKINEFDSIGI